jgi:DNA-binding Lrp family transcriptional regulator
MRAYILFKTKPGEDQQVARTLKEVSDPQLRILQADAVVGSYDVILECESQNLDDLGEALAEVIQTIPGVLQTTTCLSIRLA